MKTSPSNSATSTQTQAGLSLLQTLGILMLVGIVAAVLLKQWA